jgi:L-seryl-tRNA(Ser) seleniumtransferase
LRQLPQTIDPNLLVGSATADDAGVYRIGRDRALVQTVDFFTPIVDDPFAYGQIAATNALSDVYAMGGRPLTALNIMGVPEELVPPEVIREILRGGAAKAKEAGCALLGGHTIRNPEPIYGLAVTGLVAPSRMMTNAAARPGDRLVLTKPLGTGIVTTGIKRGLTPPALARRTIALMSRLNTVGADVAERKLCRAGVDVTGFGLLGHLASHVPRERGGSGDFRAQRAGDRARGFRAHRARLCARWHAAEPGSGQRVGGLGRVRRGPPHPALGCANQRRAAALYRAEAAGQRPAFAARSEDCERGGDRAHHPRENSCHRHQNMTGPPLRAIPSVEAAAQEVDTGDLPRPLVVEVIRRTLAQVRAEALIPERPEIMQRLSEAVQAMRGLRLQRVINATGIPLHTNFGRAPLSPAALDAMTAVAAGYSNLEYDLRSGTRGRRGEYAERCLALLCEAEAAAVVNNGAAALVLIVRHLTATKREVVISRGELVQIGGGFRLPEILESSGARLREVGTTNRTSGQDYARALGPDTGLILKVHRSNFYQGGFVESAPTEELARLAAEARVPLVEDLGSGAVADTSKVQGLEREPSPAHILRQGVNLVCFSGDKLFGGPQAGIIAGQAALVEALRSDPLFRALRCDKLILAALERTAEAHLAGRAWSGLPALEMIARTPEALRRRAEAMVKRLGDHAMTASVEGVVSEAGGGTLPRSSLASVAIALRVHGGQVERLAERLRVAHPPVIGYISEGRLLLDLRTVSPNDDAFIMTAINSAAADR